MSAWIKDWGPVITLAATAATAVFTLLAAQAARVSAGASKDSIDISRESARLAQLAAEASEQAALFQSVPVVFGIDVRPTGGGRTDIVVTAVGQGVAYNVVAAVRQDGAVGHTPMLSPIVGGETLPNRIDLLPVGFMIRPGVQYSVETTYGAAGQQFRTVRESVPGGSGVFASFERRRSEDQPWQPLW